MNNHSGCVFLVQRPTAFPKPSPGQSPGEPHPKTPFRPEGADPTTGGLGPPFQGGCDDRHAVPRALPSAGFGHALRAIRFRVPIRLQKLENAPSREPCSYGAVRRSAPLSMGTQHPSAPPRRKAVQSTALQTQSPSTRHRFDLKNRSRFGIRRHHPVHLRNPTHQIRLNGLVRVREIPPPHAVAPIRGRRPTQSE